MTTHLHSRFLHAICADRGLVEDVLGDLAEEYELRAGRDGVAAAGWWYGRELLRSAPHLLRSGLRHAWRHDPTRLAALLAGGVLTSLVVLILLLSRNGPPAQLVAGTANVVIVNNERPVRLPVRVFDAAGHPLKLTGVRFQWMSGAPVPVSVRGDVTCKEAGDAHVRISFGAISQDLLLRCRPIRELKEATGGVFVVGDSEQLSVSAVGPDGKIVDIIAASATIQDSRIASLDGAQLRPSAPGTTKMKVTAGDHSISVWVIVFGRAGSPGALQPGQAFVLKSLRLGRGESRRWPLSPGRYVLSLLPKTDDGQYFASARESHRDLTLGTENTNCVRADAVGQRFMCVALKDAAVTVYAPRWAQHADEFTGDLSVFRYEN